jgi:hypothetical protein
LYRIAERNVMAGIILNEDFENFMVSWPSEKMTEEGLKEQIDHYAGAQVDTLIFCGNGMRAMFDSHVFEPLWSGLTETQDGRIFFRGREVLDTPLPVKTNALNCKRLYENNPNPFKTRIDYARSKGIRVYAGMRMNDIHWASDPDFLMHSGFWREHPEFRRAPYQAFWTGQTLDYAHPEVREHFMRLIFEYLNRFDFDGLELDWMRTPPHFKPGCEAEGLEILNEFMHEVRCIADRSQAQNGHDVDICVRVPSDPETARRNGFDVPRWAEEKWVSHITVTNIFLCTDFDPPLELWRKLLGNDVSLAAGLEINCRQHLGAKLCFRNTEAIVNGFATSFFSRGADKLYFFNHMSGKSSMRDIQQFRNVLDFAGSLETVASRIRRHVVTARDISAVGTPESRSLLPIVPQDFASLRVNVGCGTQNRKAFILLGINVYVPELEVRLNTIPCEVSPFIPCEISFASGCNTIPELLGSLYAWKIPDGALRDGDNVIELNTTDPYGVLIDWCEIFIEPA